MTAKLSWGISGKPMGALVLTIVDGSKRSEYTFRKNGTAEAHSAMLRDVLNELGGSVPAPPVQPASVAPVAAAAAAAMTAEPYPWGGPDEEAELEKEIHSPLPMTEEESLALAKQRAWEFAQKNLGFVRGEIPDDTAARMVRAPAHSTFGQNPGYPTLEGGGVTAVDGTFIDPSAFREKPRFNVGNHED
jgi:hypothetical protein